MRARIVKRDEKIVVLKTEKDKFLKVPKKNIDFDFGLQSKKTRMKSIFFLRTLLTFGAKKKTTIIKNQERSRPNSQRS